MLEALKGLFRRKAASPVIDDGTNQMLTSQYVESLIEVVGRQRVFDRARAWGWTDETPPLWVWYQICLELLPSASASINNQSMH